MPTEVEVPKGLTLIDPNQAPKGTDASGVKVPKGLTLIGKQPQSTPNFGPQQQAGKPQSAVVNGQRVNVPSGLTLQPVTESTSTNKLMSSLREPKERRQQVYDYTVGSGYTADQARQRQNEYDYAIKNGVNPGRAQEFALGMQFEGGTPKYNLSDQEKNDLYGKAKQAAEQFKSGQQKTIESHFLGESLLPTSGGGDYYREHIDPDEYARNYVKSYSYARSQGWDEGKAQEYATSDAASQWMTRAGEWIDPKWHSVKSAILNAIPGVSKPEERAENPFFATNQGYRDNQFHVYHEAAWLDKHVGKVAGSVDAGLGNVVNGFATPGMAALMVASEGQGLLARGGLEAAGEAEEANLATRALGRVTRAGGRQLGRAAAASEQIDSAEALKAADRAEKAVQAIRDARLPVSAQKVARTFNKLVTAGFTATMAQGGVEQLGQAYKTAFPDKGEGDSSLAVEYAVEGLVSSAMALQGGNHLREEHLLTQALNDKTAEMYGPQKLRTVGGGLEEGPVQNSATKFGDLDPYRQAAVIHRLVEDDPKYKAAEDASAKEQKRLAKKIAYRYNTALQQAWNPDAVKRMVRVIDDHRVAAAEHTAEEAKRSHYLDQITKLIDLHKQDRADEAEVEAAETERRAAAREGRPVRKTEAAQKREEQRKVTLSTAAQVAEARQGVGTAREEAERESTAQEQVAAQGATTDAQKEWDERYARIYGTYARNNPDWGMTRLHSATMDMTGERPSTEPQGVVRQPDEVTDDQRYVSYRGKVFGGEEHHFGTAQDPQGNWGVYRKTPDGIQFLGTSGVFEDTPQEPFIASSEAAAKTLAQITSLRVNADYALEEHGSTPEREAERSQLRNLERGLVDGETTAEQARKAAGLPEEAAEVQAKEKANHEIEAARAGALNGPLHGRTRAQYEDDMLKEAEAAGWEGADLEGLIDALPVAARDAAENNLHYVGKSGDWIASKKGVTWVLDSKGMLQPDDGLSAPIPLMKNGRYSTQAIDLSMSGRVGFGQRSWEDAKVEDQREREANQQLDNLAQNVADEVQSSIERGRQLVGLQIEAGELPSERPAPERRRAITRPPAEPTMVSPERETDRSVEESYAASREAQRAEDAVWINAIGDYMAEHSESAWSLIERVAKNSGLTPQEVLRIQIERLSPPATLEGRIERLKAGDIISDKMGLPWVVKADRNGTLYLRKGQSARIHINKFKPSDDVRRIVGTGEVQPAPGPRYTPEDVRRAAYEAPYITRRLEAIEEVKQRETGEAKDPEPRTPEQVEAQAEAADDREVQVNDAAVAATAAASDPPPTATDKDIDEAVAKAEELRKVAEAAAKQAAAAKGRAAGSGDYPRKAPITSKRTSAAHWAVGHDGYIQTNAGKISIHRELVRLSQLTLSFRWVGNQLERVPEYPEAMQDVPPDEETRARALADAQPANYEVEQYLDPGYGPERGPAIVDVGGDVVGGNRRLLRMAKYLELIQGDDVALAQFRAHMADYAARNGMIYPEGNEIYIPVRMLDEPIETIAKATELGDLFNKKASHSIDESAKSITYGRLLFESQKDEEADGKVGVLDRVANEFNSADTPRDAMSNNPTFFAEIVKKYFKISEAENKEWFTKNSAEEYVLSVNGKEKFEKALLATVLRNPSTLDKLRGTNAYDSLLKSIGPLTRLRAIPEKDITGIIEEAIAATAATERKRVEGDSPKVRWNKTYGEREMFSEEKPLDEPSRMVEAIWRALHERKTTRFKNALNDYLVGEGVQRGMFDPQDQGLKTPADLFNAAFEDELKDVRDSRGLNTEEANSGNFKDENASGMRKYLDTLPWELTQDQFDAAMRNQPMSDEAVEDAEREEKGLPVIEPKGQIIPPGESGNIHQIEVDEAIRRFRAGEDVFAAISSGEPESGIMPLESEAEIKQFGDALYGNRKASRTLETPPAKPDVTIAAAKAEKGYVTPVELQQFLQDHPATADHAPEIMRTARMMAEYVFDSDPPEGVDKKDALDWILKERVGKLAYEEKGKGRGSYSDPNIEKGIGTRIMKLTKASDETTFIHEFAHVIFPMLSEEDMRAIDTIKGEGGEHWAPGQQLRGESYRTVSEKFAHGLERFLRDENPTGFSDSVKAVLAKVKEMFQKAYMRFRSDPLSPFNLSEEARGVFSDMFHIEDFDQADDWRKERDAARKEEGKQKKGMVKPEEVLHPVQKLAKDLGPKPVQILESIDGTVEDSSGDRVDPSKPMAAFVYGDEDDASVAYMKASEEGSGVAGAELVATKDGKYAVRFNVKAKVPKNILYQDVPEKHPGLRLEDMEAKLKTTTSPILQKFLKTQIERLKAEIRNEPKPPAVSGLAKQAVAEVKNGTAGRTSDTGRERVSDLRGVPDGTARDGQKGTGRLSRPPVMGMPGHGSTAISRSGGRPGGGSPQPINLASVTPVALVPLPERGAPVGILAGDTFDEKAWRDGLKRSGLPENSPGPTETISPKTAEVAKFAGQKQSVQIIRSALKQGDGAVLASATGTGKTYVLSGVAYETLLNNPNAKILYITKNRGLLKDASGVAKDFYGLDLEVDQLTTKFDKNFYGATYSRLRNNELYKKMNWDLVLADESGEARNWYLPQEEPKPGKKPKVHQGMLLKQVMDNAKKGVYVSATPFHSPMEYGYLDKLNLWPKGQFEDWIKNNFAHEQVGDKVIAKLDPAKQAKLREQMIERGQFVSQEISYDGYSIHFGLVPVTDMIERKLDRIHQGVAVMRRELLKQGKKGLSERVSAFEATYTKQFMERSRIEQTVELAKKGRAMGWQIGIFSENTSEDLFRRPLIDSEGNVLEEAGTYRQLDEETGGMISRIMPEFPNMFTELQAEFGQDIGDYSGRGNTDAQRREAKDAFMKGEKPILYTTYAAGGVGVSLHDTDGDKPRLAIFTGPPYSGVLLEQALGRFWRFGTKSNVYAVFLASDAEPDIRLMATKIGPRMRAVRASVLGERDSLAAVMANYTDEQKMREHQDTLAYAQGNAVKVDAQGFMVRSKRKVNFDNWSSITFPSAEEAKNKGMQVEMSGGGKGSDWATLYQEKPRRWEPPNRPLTIEDIRIRRAVNAAADKAAENPKIPSGEIAMTSVRAEEVAKAAPEGVDKEAAARDAVAGHLKGIGYVQDPLTGEWKTPEEITPADPVVVPEEKYRAGMGMTSSQEQNLIYMDRQMHTGGAGRELVTKTRRYSAMTQRELADRRLDFTKIMQENKLSPKDDRVMRDIFDVVMGKRTVSDPAINRAAGQVSAMMAKIHQLGAEGKLAVRTPDGRMIPWSAFQDDPSYMPRIADWGAKFTDGDNTYTLKEIMGGTFSEIKAKELLAKKLKEEGSSMTADRAYDLIKRERLRAPVQGNIHRTNEQNFPFIRKDYGALDNYFKQFAKAMATESEFGSDLRKLQKEIVKIPNKQARADVESMFGYMFTPQNWDSDLGRIYNTAAAMETATKMTFSASKVLFHAFNAPMVMGGKVMPILKALGHLGTDWKATRENGYYIGTVMHGIDPAVMYMPETKTQHMLFKVTGFQYLYNLGRSIAGESARVYLDQYAIDDLKKGGFAAENSRRLLKNTFLIGDHAIDEAVRTGRWSPEDYKLAQVAFANESLYGDSPLQMPSFARQRIAGEGLSTTTKRLHMAMRASYSLQSFGVKTYSMLREHLWDEVMVHHNYQPLAYAAVVAPVVGQMLQGVGAGLKGGVHRLAQYGFNKPHTEDAWDKWLAQFTGLRDQPAAAFLKLYLDGICSQWALERTKRLADALFNIGMADKKSLKSAQATGRYFLDDEIEQDIGPIWTDTVMQPMRFAGEEIEAGAGKPGTFVPRTEKNIVRHAEELSPLLRQEPHVEEFVAPKKSTGKWAVP